ncbi:MAG: DUF2244 domain-containing protein [Alphaproteobacteria bacterium]|nr:DUF2244 domain-containing protein [Alphaproteobacteria bacterium]MDE2351729.1 DUF2244 domain-containing protein [Alphaproteobacteria bacterium]
MTEPVSEPVFFDAVLHPNPPLSARAQLIVLALVAAANFGLGIAFMLDGAWPVMPFMGLDVALLAWAFRTSRKAAQCSEHVTLTPSELRIARWPARGQPSQTALNPYWVRVVLEGDVLPARKLTLWSHGKATELGSFLGPDDRASLAEALKAALRSAREYRPF